MDRCHLYHLDCFDADPGNAHRSAINNKRTISDNVKQSSFNISGMNRTRIRWAVTNTGSAKAFEGVRDVIFGSKNDPLQTGTEVFSYNIGEGVRRSMVDDWISPGTGAWRLQEIVGKSVTSFVYEKC